jgi:hypothetical protein
MMKFKSLAFAVIAASPLALGASVARAESLSGSWRGFAMGIEFDLVVQPNGAFSETERSGTSMTMQSGVIRSAGANVLAFEVQDWEPKTQQVYHPTGTVGGYYTPEPLAKPPGGVWRIQFDSPNSITMTDVNQGGSVTFSRVG